MCPPPGHLWRSSKGRTAIGHTAPPLQRSIGLLHPARCAAHLTANVPSPRFAKGSRSRQGELPMNSGLTSRKRQALRRLYNQLSDVVQPPQRAASLLRFAVRRCLASFGPSAAQARGHLHFGLAGLRLQPQALRGGLRRKPLPLPPNCERLPAKPTVHTTRSTSQSPCLCQASIAQIHMGSGRPTDQPMLKIPMQLPLPSNITL